MIDQFTLFLPHLLMALAVWRLLHRDDLDDDPSLPSRKTPFRQKRQTQEGSDDA
ncbi:hypothetical protein [Novosphingobium sp. CECT 9465]|uniref:hypothetical protein n=1 Tax=Novosphingobium sp. CECT 9465 TaxID=2829794 RepID=UPI001E2CD857|nr:hypothetical protein [Novosphingobium sp. CECT 9465]CAH0497885.1 hypothetical protein NVSP9465_02956 [Novosphingobium sp. CECT 9465]